MAQSQNLVGQSLGQYQLRQLLGKGGMGTVYRAYQASLKREVAVKVLPESLSEQPDYVERFNREATTAAGLEHPHIVAIYDFGLHGNIAYIAMRLMTGGTLTERLRTTGSHEDRPLPSLGESAKLLSQLASALDYAHSEGVIHRDVKPANTLFDNQGNAYLSDFGIAKLVASTGLTGTGFALGTPEFMAPEQWQNAKLVVPASDQYALAIMAYILVAGRAPFLGDTPFNLMYKHLHEMPTPPNAWRADVPEAVATVLYRAMAKTPAERFETVTAFAQAFERAVVGAEGSVTGVFSPSGRRQAGTPLPKPASNPPSKPPTKPPTGPTVTGPTSAPIPRKWLFLIGLILIFGVLAGVVVTVVVLQANNHPTAIAVIPSAPAVLNTPLPTTAEAPTQLPATSTTVPAASVVVPNTPLPDPTTTPAPSIVVTQTTIQPLSPGSNQTIVPPATVGIVSTPSPAVTATLKPSPTSTSLPSATPTRTATATSLPTNTLLPTATPSFTPTSTKLLLPSATPTLTATVTITPTSSPTNTPRPTATLTPTVTQTSSATKSNTASPTPTPTATATRVPATLSPTAGSNTASPTVTTGVATAGANPPISVANAAQLTKLTALPKFRGTIGSLQFASDSGLLAFTLISTTDTTVRLYNVGLGQIQAACQASNPQFSLNGTSIALIDPNSIFTVEDAKCQTRTTLKGVSSAVLDVDFSPDGKLIATSHQDGTVRLWTVATGQVRSLYRAGAVISNLTFSLDGTLLIGTTNNGVVLVWDVLADKPLSSHPTHITKMAGPAVAANGSVALGGATGTLLLWDVKNGTAITTFKGHTDTVNSVSLSQDGTLLASGSDDKTVRVWNTATGQELFRQTFTANVTNVALSQDGTLLAISTRDGVIQLLGIQ